MTSQITLIYIFNQEVIYTLYKDLLNFNKKKDSLPKLKNIWKRYYTEMENQIVTYIYERPSTLVRIRCIVRNLTFLSRWPGLCLQLVAHTVRSLPTMQETPVWFLGGEDPLEKEMATHSHILAWKIPWAGEPGDPQYMGLHRVGQDWMINTLTLLIFKLWRCHAL